MAKTPKPCATDTAAPGMHPAYYQLHALLGTLRQMTQHEDDICTLLEELGRTGKMNSKLKRDLRTLLDSLHVESLASEASMLWHAVEEKAAA